MSQLIKTANVLKSKPYGRFEVVQIFSSLGRFSVRTIDTRFGRVNYWYKNKTLSEAVKLFNKF